MFVHTFEMTDSIKIHYTITRINFKKTPKNKKKLKKNFFLAISSFYFASARADPVCEAASWQL